uniref:Uncharacterized protein n=1 Tax=Acrobeloides nanus TaxID=290746 RepID=A0A914CH03_9BILA
MDKPAKLNAASKETMNDYKKPFSFKKPCDDDCGHIHCKSPEGQDLEEKWKNEVHVETCESKLHHLMY